MLDPNGNEIDEPHGDRKDPRAAHEPPRVDAFRLRDRMADGEPIVFVDARPPEEWNRAHLTLPEAVRIAPEPEVQADGQLPRDASVVVYCTSHTERWSARVARSLMEHGFEKVSVLRGGFDAWRAIGGPLALR